MMRWSGYRLCYLAHNHIARAGHLGSYLECRALSKKSLSDQESSHSDVNVNFDVEVSGKNYPSDVQNQNEKTQQEIPQKSTVKICMPSDTQQINSERRSVDKQNRYFQSVWIQSQDKVTKTPKYPNDLQLKKEEDQIADRNVFGTLVNEEIESYKDKRHHNERLQEKMPGDDVEGRSRRLDIPLTRYGRIGKTAIYYSKKMARLGREGKIREAVSMYDDIMIHRDRVLPKKRTFVILIGILGRVGYHRKAFQLFRQMKQLGFDPEDHIYTSLFNACANSPSRTDGLQRAEKLIRYLQENEIKPNLFTVKCCMKALAVCGDFPRAFAVLDEASTRLDIDSECFNALLIACISDKTAGFLRAIQVWQKMQEIDIRPETSTYNLLLRCVRDCGIGDPAKFDSTLGLKSGEANLGSITSLIHKKVRWISSLEPSPIQPMLQAGNSEISSSNICSLQIEKANETSELLCGTRLSQDDLLSTENSNDIHIKSHVHTDEARAEEHENNLESDDSKKSSEGMVYSEKMPGKDTSRIYTLCKEDMLSPKIQDVLLPDFEEQKPKLIKASVDNANTVVKSTRYPRDLKTAEDRLALMGGSGQFLSHMIESGASPDLKTLTQMLACLPNNSHTENHLLSSMEEFGVKPDVDFLNDIMMRRFRRKQYESIKAVLYLMSKLQLTPNMRTYAALALTCHTKEKAFQLIEDMKCAYLDPSVEVMSHLLMVSYGNYTYKLHMLQMFENLGHRPTTRILTNIEKAIALSKKKIVQAEKDGDTDTFYLSNGFRIPFRNFLNFYRQWLQRTEMSRPEHPWKAFEPVNKDEEDTVVQGHHEHNTL